MGHKGVSVRKLPKSKVKPVANANQSGGLISDLAHSEKGLRQGPGNSGASPFGNSGMNPVPGSKKPHKKH
jgi:hypothetical protein